MYLTRNESEKCVMARIVRQRQLYQRNFTLRQYGTWTRAESAARKWVKEKLQELPPPIPQKDRMTSRNSSGVVGVRLVHSVRRRGEREYGDWRWIAYWPGCENVGGVGFSVQKYGDETAFVLACLARRSETVDRARLEAALVSMRRTADYRRLLRLKRIEPT